MPPKEFFVQVYYIGHVQRTDAEGVVFSCNNSSLFKVKKNIKLDGLIQSIQIKIQQWRFTQVWWMPHVMKPT